MSRYYGIESPFGGTDYMDESGKIVASALPGIFDDSARDIFDASGRHIGYTIPSIFGGDNIYHDDYGAAGYSVPSALGGDTLYHSDGSYAGYSVEGPLGSVTDFSDPFEF